MGSNDYHESVMVREVLENLHLNNRPRGLKKASKYIDATLGTGGHALEIIKAGGNVLGIEADPEMLKIAKERMPEGNFVLGNFTSIDKIAKANDFDKISGILFDLGATNLQLMSDRRGFSFGNPDADLDMRLNPEVQGVKGADLLNVLREDQLKYLFGVTLEAGSVKWLVKRILQKRPIKTVGDFS